MYMYTILPAKGFALLLSQITSTKPQSQISDTFIDFSVPLHQSGQQMKIILLCSERGGDPGCGRVLAVSVAELCESERRDWTNNFVRNSSHKGISAMSLQLVQLIIVCNSVYKKNMQY